MGIFFWIGVAIVFLFFLFAFGFGVLMGVLDFIEFVKCIKEDKCSGRKRSKIKSIRVRGGEEMTKKDWKILYDDGLISEKTYLKKVKKVK